MEGFRGVVNGEEASLERGEDLTWKTRAMETVFTR